MIPREPAIRDEGTKIMDGGMPDDCGMYIRVHERKTFPPMISHWYFACLIRESTYENLFVLYIRIRQFNTDDKNIIITVRQSTDEKCYALKLFFFFFPMTTSVVFVLGVLKRERKRQLYTRLRM